MIGYYKEQVDYYKEQLQKEIRRLHNYGNVDMEKWITHAVRDLRNGHKLFIEGDVLFVEIEKDKLMYREHIKEWIADAYNKLSCYSKKLANTKKSRLKFSA